MKVTIKQLVNKEYICTNTKCCHYKNCEYYSICPDIKKEVNNEK